MSKNLGTASLVLDKFNSATAQSKKWRENSKHTALSSKILHTLTLLTVRTINQSLETKKDVKLATHLDLSWWLHLMFMDIGLNSMINLTFVRKKLNIQWCVE